MIRNHSLPGVNGNSIFLSRLVTPLNLYVEESSRIPCLNAAMRSSPTTYTFTGPLASTRNPTLWRSDISYLTVRECLGCKIYVGTVLSLFPHWFLRLLPLVSVSSRNPLEVLLDIA